MNDVDPLGAVIGRLSPEDAVLFIGIALTIHAEVEAERYEWAKFWRDEAIDLFGAPGRARGGG